MITQIVLDWISTFFAFGVEHIPNLPPEMAAWISELSPSMVTVFAAGQNFGIIIPFSTMFTMMGIWLGALVISIGLYVVMSFVSVFSGGGFR